jgi:serine/threonine protein kinase
MLNEIIYILFYLFSHSKASDMWSVGVFLYVMMYLKYPFKGNNQMVVAGAILEGRKEEPPQNMMNIYSPELKAILSSLLINVYY